MTRLAVRPAPADRDGPRIVVIHGAMDRAATFEPTRRRLHDLAVVTYDRRGYGRSGRLPENPDLSTHVSDALSVMGGEPVVLVGHSFGGLVALAASVRAPEQVLAVGVYEPPMPWEPWWPESAAGDDPATAGERFFRRIAGDDTWDAMPQRFRQARAAEGPALLCDFASARAGLPFDLRDVLSPVAAAHGSETAPHFKRSAQTLAERVHGATLRIIEGAGHGAHMSHTDAFAAWVRDIVEHRTAPQP